jgi:hypothetical protein
LLSPVLLRIPVTMPTPAFREVERNPSEILVAYPAHAGFGEEFPEVRTVRIVTRRATEFLPDISHSRAGSLDRMDLALGQ